MVISEAFYSLEFFFPLLHLSEFLLDLLLGRGVMAPDGRSLDINVLLADGNENILKWMQVMAMRNEYLDFLVSGGKISQQLRGRFSDGWDVAGYHGSCCWWRWWRFAGRRAAADGITQRRSRGDVRLWRVESGRGG